MRNFQSKNELEREADELLAADTARRGSGLTRYDRSPAREVLLDDFATLAGTGGVYDSYPSDEPAVLDENIRMRYLRGMIKKLSPRQQECLELVVLQGLSERQAGAELGVAGGTVSKHLSAGLARLRAMGDGDELFRALFPDMTD
jgi:RNA polymerase sigma factor (sigma-70 family)